MISSVAPAVGRPVELSRLGAGFVEHLLQRIGAERRRPRPIATMSVELTRAIGSEIRWDCKAAWHGNKDAPLNVVVWAEQNAYGRRVALMKRGEGDEAVAARAILDHDRLAPPGAELFRDDTRADIGA